jgi:Zn-dependent peptidase ImmA (M78 family)
MAASEGERLTVRCNMGEIPAIELPRVMEQDFGILVLMVDMDDRMSGAACRLPEMDAVLVNRKENPGRRNFDLAHEFFHLLTWDTMPPKPVEEGGERARSSRTEKLADNFAAALLMPRRLLEAFGEWLHLGAAERAARMRKVADHFQVSVTALHWRLVFLGLLSKNTEMVEVPAPSATYLQNKPLAFSRSFLSVVARGIENGLVSVGRAVKLLGLSRDALRDLFVAHGVPAPLTV